MALLAGNDVITGGANQSSSNSGRNLTVLNIFTASASGTATAVLFYRVTSGGFNGTVTAMRAGIYDSSGNLLGESGEVTTLPAGWITFTLGTSVTITSGVQYAIGLMADGWFGGYAISGAAETRSQTQTYGALPASITLNGGTRETFDTLATYIDGTTGGGGGGGTNPDVRNYGAQGMERYLLAY